MNLFKYLPHYLRKRINEKFIIIESDDWGLERAITYDAITCLEKRHGKERLSRWTFDSLETPDDLDELYGVLEKYKSKFDLPPVITANFITHNIDYSSFDKLRFIPISKGFNNDENKLMKLYKTGIENNFIFPQLHGYSHYNIFSMNEYFNTGEGKEAFEERFFSGKNL